jgi:chromosome segregation ATPase
MSNVREITGQINDLLLKVMVIEDKAKNALDVEKCEHLDTQTQLGLVESIRGGLEQKINKLTSKLSEKDKKLNMYAAELNDRYFQIDDFTEKLATITDERDKKDEALVFALRERDALMNRKEDYLQEIKTLKQMMCNPSSALKATEKDHQVTINSLALVRLKLDDQLIFNQQLCDELRLSKEQHAATHDLLEIECINTTKLAKTFDMLRKNVEKTNMAHQVTMKQLEAVTKQLRVERNKNENLTRHSNGMALKAEEEDHQVTMNQLVAVKKQLRAERDMNTELKKQITSITKVLDN